MVTSEDRGLNTEMERSPGSIQDCKDNSRGNMRSRGTQGRRDMRSLDLLGS